MIQQGEIKIIDNALSKDDFIDLKKSFDYIDWGNLRGVVYGKEDEIQQYVVGIYDGFVPRSDIFWRLEPLFFALQPKAFVRIKANKIPKTETHRLPDYHKDISDCVTAIYYLNTTNGKTVFKNGKQVDCIENRLVVFDSNLEHSGYTCTDKEHRMLINFNYYERLPEERIII